MTKLLLDENVALKMKQDLIKLGFENVKHINDFGKGLKDEYVFNIAKDENRILISGDDDFKKKEFKNKCGIIWMTPKARFDKDIVKKIVWILENIKNYNINIYSAFISIKRDQYYIYYKQGMNKKLKEKEISFNKIKEFKLIQIIIWK